MFREPRSPRTFLRRQWAQLTSATCIFASATSVLQKLALLTLLTPLACTSTNATENDCDAILTRIVELEIREQGYRDPALVKRKQARLRRTFADEIARCVGRRLPQGAMECIATASSAEQVSHTCLR